MSRSCRPDMRDRSDMSAEAVSSRLKLVARSSDLAPERRLAAKVELTAEAVTLRLRQVAGLRRLCLRLAASSAADGRRAPGGSDH